MEPTTRTTQPYVTGTSVLAVKYKDGIMMAADTLASYGSMARFRSFCRFHKISRTIALGASGDMSDFQHATKLLDTLVRKDAGLGEQPQRSPKEIHQYISRVCYEKRSKMDPLWNVFIIAGIEKEEKFLGFVDLLGTEFEADYAATGYGRYLALPLLRKNWREDLSKEDARSLLEDSMRVLWYRDARTINKIQLADITGDGVTISEPFELSAEWSLKGFVQPDPNDVPQLIKA